MCQNCSHGSGACHLRADLHSGIAEVVPLSMTCFICIPVPQCRYAACTCIVMMLACISGSEHASASQTQCRVQRGKMFEWPTALSRSYTSVLGRPGDVQPTRPSMREVSVTISISFLTLGIFILQANIGEGCNSMLRSDKFMRHRTN